MTEAKQLHIDGIITAGELESIEHYEATKLFSIHWELRTLLYTGILLLTSGIGVLVYKNIDTIGHQTVLAAIAVTIIACFYYLLKHKQPYSNAEVKQLSPLFDYVALLACLLFGTFIGYLQFEYQPFGSHLWLATLLPSILFLYCAYAYDHKGLLALEITGFISTMGLSIAPMQLLDGNNFTDSTLLITALALGVALIIIAISTNHLGIKRHFGFSYHHFAATLMFVACLAFLFNYPYKLISILLLSALCVYFTKYAIAAQSLLFLLYAAVYTYIGLTYVMFFILLDAISDASGEGTYMLGMLYLLASCAGVIFFFVNYKKILRLS